MRTILNRIRSAWFALLGRPVVANTTFTGSITFDTDGRKSFITNNSFTHTK